MATRTVTYYQEDLEAQLKALDAGVECTCGDHTAHSLTLMAKCHPRHGLAVEYNPATGLLTFECVRCGLSYGGAVVVARDPKRAN
jgi:hypothetical protein